MAHPMIEDALERFYPETTYKEERLSLLAQTSENTLISIMHQVDKDIELSSLPMFIDGVPKVEISLAGKDILKLKKNFELFISELKKLRIDYKII